eukprot:TRINITY_DN18761_c0_g1_i1.p1 TRINITY_DN18761_c0_g1~~TRINITY_DN18761_c0_g1_i1.p1  ORF type:complete len:240 (-),score=34.55 TRINITY_DN18761_c0_g1_i1:5-628(-)
MRLIEFNETTRVWMSERQIREELVECVGGEKNFMDITDNPHLGDNSSEVFRASPPVPPNVSHQAQVSPLLSRLAKDHIRDNIQHFTSYPTRYYTTQTGLTSAEWLFQQYKQYTRSGVTVHYFHHKWLQPSIVARIEGQGVNQNQVVIIGGHIDSTSSRGDAPGADDDASGSMTVLEVFRVLAESGFKPSRTLEFHAYAASGKLSFGP